MSDERNEMMKSKTVGVAALAAIVMVSGTAGAQTRGPVAPKTVLRENGAVVVRAIRLNAPLKVDGKLDESVYSENEPIDGFIQAVPANGKPVSERTEAWIMFDDKFIYIAAKLYDSSPPSQ